MKRKITIKTQFVLIFVLFASITLILALVSADNTSKVKEGRIIINDPAQNGSFFISSANISQNETISPILRTDFDFNALYLQWEQDSSVNSNDFDIYVKFLNESWTDWLKIQLDDDNNGKDGVINLKQSSQMIPTKLTDSFQYKIVFDPHAQQKPKITNLAFVYLDSTKGPQANFKISTQNDSLNIISRSAWGANENYKFDEEGNDLWEEEYYTPKKFVIHHTAGEKANQNPMATVRAIQHWHANSLEWGDIGYNYLIDSQGNIYEGRTGGDGVVGGHAYMRNRNTIGIGILGCYDSGSRCNSPDNLTQATKNSLNKLIALKSREFNIDPMGKSEFHGEILPNIIGHSDVGSTTCPGDLIYNELDQTKSLAYNILQDMGGYQKPLPTSAKFVRQSSREITIEETKTSQIIVEFKNTGQAIWRGYEDAGLFVAEESIKNQLAKIGSVRIAMSNTSKTPLVQYNLLGGNVYPGETGQFKLVLQPPTNTKQITKNYTLAWQDKGYFPQTDFSITVNRIACSSCNTNQVEKINPIYSATLTSSTFPAQMPDQDLKDVIIQFKNTGNKTLSQDKLKLHVIYEKKHISPFRNNSWYSEYALIPPKESSVYPNGTATFEFKLKSPSVVAPFPHTITLFYDDIELYKWDKTIEIISSYASQITTNTLPVAVKNTWRPTVKLTFKNTGTKTWKSPKLKSYDIDYTNSWFRDRSWADNKTIKKSWTNVDPGESITFEFKITPYWKANTYPHVYKLFDGDDEIYINGKKEFLTYTRVDR
jgi:N-acetylmuramoyl-L-alanine amidase-like protein